MVTNLEGYQRAALMKYAHHLKPVASVGKHGLTPQLAAHVDRELQQHELIKIRFVDFKPVRGDITRQLGADLDATVVSIIGNIGVLYRESPDPERRTVMIPERR
jgi:RNA-binding protein